MVDIEAGRALIAEVDATLEGVSEEPWVPDIDDPQTAPMWTGKFYTGTEGSTWCTYNEEPWTIANVRFTGAARSNVPRLRDALAAALDEIEQLRRTR